MDTLADDVGTLQRDGIVGHPGAFDPAWVRDVRADVDAAFEQALARPGGAVGRGPHRYYSELHPEQLRGFVELVTHPWVAGVAEAVLGPDHEIVEVGFDVPLPGARNQPWHRDFPSAQGRDGQRLISLAFNLTLVDTVPEMGPFEIAPGTQWDDGPEFEHGMFPPRSVYGRYEERATQKLPKVGDVSVRSALTVHRGTANVSDQARPVLVLGVDAPGAGNSGHHDLAITRAFEAGLPAEVRRHLRCPVVDELRPITQKHTIEGLVMGEA